RIAKRPGANARRMMSSEPTTLEYRTATSPRRRTFSLGAFIASAVVIAALAIDLVFIVPRCMAIFWDFAVLESALTNAMFLVSRWFTRGGWAVLVSIPPVVGLIAARYENETDHRKRRML